MTTLFNNPTIRIAERRRFIAERIVELQKELGILTAEASDLDTAERILKRFSEPPSVGGQIKSVPLSTSDDAVEASEMPSLPQMILTVLEEAKTAGRNGVEGYEIVSIVKERWKPGITINDVRSTLWRMAHRQGRLKQHGKKYYLAAPVSSPEGETGALLGTPVH